MSEPLRAGVVGCGQVARYLHIPSYLNCPKARLVALYNHRLDTVADLQEKLPEVAIWDDYERFLADSGVQLLSLCTPNAFHAEMAMAALRRGIHVLVEKPMAVSLAEAQAMMAAAQDSRALLMVGHSRRYFPSYRQAFALLRDGVLGRLFQVQAALGHSGPLDWSPRGQWFVTAALAGRGVIGDLAVHVADMLRFLTGQEVRQVAALQASFEQREVEDNAVAVLRLSGGALAVLSASWTLHGGIMDQVVLAGEEGILHVGVEKGYPLVLHKATGERIVYPVADGVPQVDGALQLDMIAEFVEAVLGQRPNPIPGEEGYRALEICIALERSARTGQIIHLPLAD
jgi:predicted dehydrogenase